MERNGNPPLSWHAHDFIIPIVAPFKLMPPLLLTASAVAATVCPLLSARLLIPVSTELLVYPVSIFAAICAVVVLITRRRESEDRIWAMRNLANALIGAVVVVLILAAWRNSNDLFFRWSLVRISEETRKALDSEMTSLGEKEFKGLSDDAVQVIKQELPPLFSGTVGRDSDFAYGLAQKDSSGRINVGLAYGYKARRWGVFRGSFIASKWPNAKTRKLYGETFYFVTTDY